MVQEGGTKGVGGFHMVLRFNRIAIGYGSIASGIQSVCTFRSLLLLEWLR